MLPTMQLTRTIGFRLFLLIASVQAAILAAFMYATVHIQREQLMDNVHMSAARVSNVIVRSTRHSMLLNRKEEVHNIIASVSGEPGMEGLRIYNKQGEVIFAGVPMDIHTTVDMTAEACITCHSPTGLENPHPTDSRLSRIFTNPNGDRILGLITPIRNEAQCSDAPCHAHPADKTILGVLDVKMSLAQIDSKLEKSTRQMLSLSLGAVLLISLVSGGFIYGVVRKPVKRLMEGMEMVASGHLDHRLEAGMNDELGQLAARFNSMTEDLRQAREQLTAWSQTLEEKVKEKTDDLERAYRKMANVEKMASLGNLAATVAHELNNPLEGILTFGRLLIKRVKKSALPPEDVKAFVDDLTLVADEAQRMGDIVKNLLVFARQQGGEFQQTPLRTIVDRCVLLMNHHAQMHQVRLTASCPDDLVIECDPNKIQQALIALMVNAVEAMSGTAEREGGELSVTIQPVPDGAQITVRDTGVGMSDEVKAHIFEPFFTTKAEVKGVGLGLAVVYGIVDLHHGTIDVVSSPGRGTTFTVTLPAQQPRSRQTQNTAHHGAQA